MSARQVTLSSTQPLSCGLNHVRHGIKVFQEHHGGAASRSRHFSINWVGVVRRSNSIHVNCLHKVDQAFRNCFLFPQCLHLLAQSKRLEGIGIILREICRSNVNRCTVACDGAAPSSIQKIGVGLFENFGNMIGHICRHLHPFRLGIIMDATESPIVRDKIASSLFSPLKTAERNYWGRIFCTGNRFGMQNKQSSVTTPIAHACCRTIRLRRIAPVRGIINQPSRTNGELCRIFATERASDENSGHLCAPRSHFDDERLQRYGPRQVLARIHTIGRRRAPRLFWCDLPRVSGCKAAVQVSA